MRAKKNEILLAEYRVSERVQDPFFQNTTVVSGNALARQVSKKTNQNAE